MVDFDYTGDAPMPIVDTFEPDPTKGSYSFSKWYNCVVCGERLAEKDTTVYRGKRYGITCGCSRDIVQLASRGQ